VGYVAGEVAVTLVPFYTYFYEFFNFPSQLSNSQSWIK